MAPRTARFAFEKERVMAIVPVLACQCAKNPCSRPPFQSLLRFKLDERPTTPGVVVRELSLLGEGGGPRRWKTVDKLWTAGGCGKHGTERGRISFHHRR